LAAFSFRFVWHRLNLRRAAVNEKFDASDKTGVGRREKKRSRRDFFGFANAAHGNLRDELVFDFLGYVGPLFLWRRFSKLPPSTTVLTERFYKTVVVGTESFGSELNVLFDVTFSRYPSVINA
jgi:hypothetical protein